MTGPGSAGVPSAGVGRRHAVALRRTLRVLVIVLLSIVFVLAKPVGAQAPSQPRPIPPQSLHSVDLIPTWHPPRPQPSSSSAPKRLVGRASWYSSWCNCIAMRQWRGRTVLVTGPAGSSKVRITDYGPSKRLFPERVIDLNPDTFREVCGPLKIGTCKVIVTLLK